MKSRYTLIIFLGSFLLSACSITFPGENQDVSQDLMISPTPKNQLSIQQTNTEDSMTIQELIIENLVEGNGAVASTGATLTVHYIGTLLDGTKFDSSYDRGQPFSFQLGAGRVIAGWDQGLQGMKIGGKRKLTIPARLAYGDRQVSRLIPPNSPLVFEIELLGIQ